MGRKRHPIYDVDRETQKLLEACLNLAAQTAQLQISEEGAEGIANPYRLHSLKIF